MKNIKLPAAATLFITLIAPLPGQDNNKPKSIDEPFYPLRENVRWIYRVVDKKTKDQSDKKQYVAVTVGKREIFEIKTKDPKSLRDVVDPYVGYALHVQAAGNLKFLDEQVLVKEDGVYRVSGAGKTITPPLCFFKSKVQKGSKWDVDSRSENAELKGTFEVDEEAVQVPAGAYKTLVVRCRDFQVGAQRMQVATWYAEKVGMVKQHVQVGQHDVVLELEKIEVGR